ncbi:hypothetical protein [Streptomyces swartbergensis]|uniref:hypothetical protein n=1 Tax=Streptomyces swartbergensis TaxID=487165 RepID=UPI003829E6DD
MAHDVINWLLLQPVTAAPSGRPPCRGCVPVTVDVVRHLIAQHVVNAYERGLLRREAEGDGDGARPADGPVPGDGTGVACFCRRPDPSG